MRQFLFFSEITRFRDFLFCFPNRAALYVILYLEGPLQFPYYFFFLVAVVGFFAFAFFRFLCVCLSTGDEKPSNF